MKRTAIFLAAALVALSGWAQGPQTNPKIVGKLKDVQGLVTVSSGDQLTSAVSGAALIVNNRIITTSSGAVTLVYDNGCDIKLKENQSFTVKEDNSCAALLASVQSVGAAGASPALAAAAGTNPALLVGAGVALLLIANSNNNSQLSPN